VDVPRPRAELARVPEDYRARVAITNTPISLFTLKSDPMGSLINREKSPGVRAFLLRPGSGPEPIRAAARPRSQTGVQIGATVRTSDHLDRSRTPRLSW
jgi:hypothetical protein